MTLSAGTRLGPYEILAPVGAGGMGEVYKARDTRLQREVAIKVLPAGLASDPERLKRFEREARSASSLNHPNIVTIYDIGSADSVSYIAMELVSGEPLREVLAEGALPVRRLLQIGAQVAEGLAKAHAAGIVHRDLKPENVMVTEDGLVKILDFGLAKLTQPEGSGAGATMAPTVSGATEDGIILGTVGYMSPEQAMGGSIDFRSDQFSFGSILYEMATGKRAFQRGSAPQTLTAIIQDEPQPIAGLNAKIPAPVRWIVERCLAKEPRNRYTSTDDLAKELATVRERLSEATREAISGSAVSPVSAAPTGRRMGRSIGIALAAVAALLVVLFYFVPRRVAPLDSLAVLPFSNASGDPSSDYLSDGLTEGLINGLSRLPVRVKSRSTVFRYRNREDPDRVGRELGVRAVLTGRVARRLDAVDVQTELVEVSTGAQLWGERYSDNVANILDLQQQITTEIARRLGLRLTGEQKERLARRDTTDPEAYQLYLKGRYHWNRRSEEHLKKGISFFQQAIDRDPGYARAYSGLADCYTSLGFSFDSGALAPKDAMPKAEAAARKALEIDASLAEALTSLAFIRFLYDWNWAESERLFRRAIALDPRYANAHHWYSHLLVATKRFDESLAESKRALELDPLDLVINAHLGWNYIYAGQLDLAIEQMRRTLELDPNYGFSHRMLALALEAKGSLPEATAEFRKAILLLKESTEIEAELAHALAVSSDHPAAEKVLESLRDLSTRRYVSPYWIAAIHAGLGVGNEAFSWLEKAYTDRADAMVYLATDPRLGPIRSDPRFADLLGRVGLLP